MNKILIVCNSFLHKDPRVLRQIEALKDNFEIETMGFTAANEANKHYSIQQPKQTKKYYIQKGLRLLLRNYKKINFTLSKTTYTNESSYQFILCNDVDAIPLGLEISKGKIPIWTDLHEYAPREFENSFLWRLLYAPYKNWMCLRYLKQCACITNVCQTIANEYEKQFKVKTNEIITNAPAYQPEKRPKPVNDKIKIIHHGGAMPNRNLQHMVEMMQYIDDSFELYMMLVTNTHQQKAYLNTLKELAVKLNVTVHFKKPVPTTQIANEINQYDIGLFILPPVTFNWKYALPNKLFEYIQARLAIAISPNPEMKKLVEDYNLGVVAKNYSAKAMADSIKSLSKDDILRFKNNCHTNAQELSSEKNKLKMIQIATSLTS